MTSPSFSISVLKHLLFCFLLIVPLAPQYAAAHELLPEALLEYTREHPDATAEDINAFLEQNPDLSSQVIIEDPGDLIEAARTQSASFRENAWRFIVLGIEHILIGADHVLFVLAFLLTFASLKQTLKLITSFTIAHSITLILAGTGAFVLSSTVVEPLIAFSIAYVAISSVFLQKYKFFRERGNKILSIFFFGLFHGLGFAGLLTDLSVPPNRFISSLLFFNVGIEIGQLMVIAVALPLLFLLRKIRWHDTALKSIAVLIALIALFWTAERIIGAIA
jgi:hypothetical protein